MDDLLNRFNSLTKDVKKEQIEKTAQDLKRRNYMPPFILNVNDFYHFTKDKMIEEYNRVITLSSDSEELKAVTGLSDTDEIKRVHLTTLLNQYNLLCRLREGEADAWDTVNELYEDD